MGREGGREGGTLNSPERLQLGSQHSVQTVQAAVFDFKLRWDFPCQLMPSLSLTSRNGNSRAEICHRRDDRGFP